MPGPGAALWAGEMKVKSTKDYKKAWQAAQGIEEPWIEEPVLVERERE